MSSLTPFAFGSIRIAWNAYTSTKDVEIDDVWLFNSRDLGQRAWRHVGRGLATAVVDWARRMQRKTVNSNLYVVLLAIVKHSPGDYLLGGCATRPATWWP